MTNDLMFGAEQTDERHVRATSSNCFSHNSAPNEVWAAGGRLSRMFWRACYHVKEFRETSLVMECAGGNHSGGLRSCGAQL